MNATTGSKIGTVEISAEEYNALVAALEDSADAIDAVCVHVRGGALDALREINRRNRTTLAAARVGKAVAS